MSVYQQGLLALHKMRQNGQQRIMMQYVNVSQGSQAVIENIERDSGEMWSLNLLCPRADCPRGNETGYGFGGCEIFFRRMGRDAKDDCHGALSKIPDPITQAIFATAGVEV